MPPDTDPILISPAQARQAQTLQIRVQLLAAAYERLARDNRVTASAIDAAGHGKGHACLATYHTAKADAFGQTARALRDLARGVVPPTPRH